MFCKTYAVVYVSECRRQILVLNKAIQMFFFWIMSILTAFVFKTQRIIDVPDCKCLKTRTMTYSSLFFP